MSLEVVVEGTVPLGSPCFDAQGRLYACSPITGEIYRVTDRLSEITNTNGQPNGLQFDPKSGALFVADLGHQAILRWDEGTGITEFVGEYEGRAFKGPNSLTFDSAGNLFFTDSGPLGETTLAQPRGSVFASMTDLQVLQPLTLASLAHPSGLCQDRSGRNIFVCEMMANRILRFSPRPSGVYHCSVFHQFSGCLGPSAIAAHPDGRLYVARYDFSGNAEEGSIVTLLPTGECGPSIHIPGSEITGLALDPEGRYLYIAEGSTNTIFRHPCFP